MGAVESWCSCMLSRAPCRASASMSTNATSHSMVWCAACRSCRCADSADCQDKIMSPAVKGSKIMASPMRMTTAAAASAMESDGEAVVSRD